MNAETSARGRAIVAVGISAKKNASQEEVRNRLPFADQLRQTGMKRNDISMWLLAEGGYSDEQVPKDAKEFAGFLNGLSVERQTQLLEWSRGK